MDTIIFKLNGVEVPGDCISIDHDIDKTIINIRTAVTISSVISHGTLDSSGNILVKGTINSEEINGYNYDLPKSQVQTLINDDVSRATLDQIILPPLEYHSPILEPLYPQL